MLGLPVLRHHLQAVRGLPKLVFLGNTFDATDLTTYAFTGRFLGDPHPTRAIILGIHCEDAATSFSVSSATIQLVTTTSVVTSAATPAIKAGMRIARVPSGFYGDISITFSEAITSCGISLWAAYNLRSLTPFHTGTATADATAVNLNVEANGFAIGLATNAAAADTCTWTNLTEQYDASATDIQMTGAHVTTQTAGVRACTADFVTGTAVQAAYASFR